MTDRHVLAADVLAMLMGAAILVMCVMAYMDGTHDLLLPSTTVHFEPVFPSDGIEVFVTDGGLVHAA